MTTAWTPTVVARSIVEANLEIHALGPRVAVVSIGEPGTDPPYGFQPHHPLHLRLEFRDIEDGSEGPERVHVDALLRHALVLRTAETVYCHCVAGISRSTAVAFILRCLWSPDGHEVAALDAVYEDRPEAMPNPALVALADVALERDGRMIAALKARPLAAVRSRSPRNL